MYQLKREYLEALTATNAHLLLPPVLLPALLVSQLLHADVAQLQLIHIDHSQVWGHFSALKSQSFKLQGPYELLSGQLQGHLFQGLCYKTLNYKTPNYRTPNFKTSNCKTPNCKTPNYKTSNLTER
jgi:hypothetical protein